MKIAEKDFDVLPVLDEHEALNGQAAVQLGWGEATDEPAREDARSTGCRSLASFDLFPSRTGLDLWLCLSLGCEHGS